MSTKTKVRLQITVLTAKLVVLALCALVLSCLTLAGLALLFYLTWQNEYKWFTVPICVVVVVMIAHSAKKTWQTVMST